MDYDGYPTKEELRKIKKWDIIRDPIGLVHFIEENCWWMPDWGFKLTGKKVFKLQLHTGGWSGNEDVIRVLHENLFWNFYWVKSIRGGHYWFEIKIAKPAKK